jgi:hypothetical protein
MRDNLTTPATEGTATSRRDFCMPQTMPTSSRTNPKRFGLVR